MKRKIVFRRFLPALFCLLLLIYGAARLIAYFATSQTTEQTNAELLAMYETEKAEAAPDEAVRAYAPAPTAVPASTPRPTLLSAYQLTGAAMLPEMRELYAKNQDLVGWVRIPGVVSLPVVYRNNSYYLKHDFYGKRSSAGALFLDENHPLTARTQYLVIHGHNMHDGSMFGLLGHYRKLAYVREHGLVSFSTLYRKERYALFAVLLVPEDVRAAGYVAYTGTPAFQTEKQFDAFVEKIRSNSKYRIPVSVSPSDALLTLSTCLDGERLILVFRRLREDESPDQMLEALSQSTKR